MHFSEVTSRRIFARFLSCQLLLVLIADKVHLKGRYGAEFKLTRSELFVERSKRALSLTSATFAPYAYFFEVAWRSNLDDHLWDRARACKTRDFHGLTLEPGKYATEIRGPQHVQLDFSHAHTSPNWTDQGRPIEKAVVTVAAGRYLYPRWPWLAKGCSHWSPTANQWFFLLYSNARRTINKRRTSPGSWSQELSSHAKINQIRQWRPKWRQF